MKYRYIAKIYGIVQGVGFRPFVYNLAIKNSIKGWVSNDGSSLIIDLEGEKNNIKKFILEIIKSPPPMANIRRITCSAEEVLGYDKFVIRKSTENNEGEKYLLSDIAICEDCSREIKDKKSIWYDYPFTSCTNCGPRYSIMNILPYDRETTNMKEFQMCSSCEDKYKSSKDRRFHAQTISCPSCGPVLTLIDNKGEVVERDNAIKLARELIRRGKILAIKGIGGFHLCCDAFNNEAVKTLRNRKNRPDKPLALMMRDIETVKDYVQVSEKEEEVLKSSAAPIVLLKMKSSLGEKFLSTEVAPKMTHLGIMLPYTPLHHLMFNDDLSILVMTSGNISGGTVEYDNKSAVKNLNTIADYFLIHDRKINIPIDDSVVKIINNKVSISRIGRGYAPFYVNLELGKRVLALGSDMKNTFALGDERWSLLSQYGGDLKNYQVYEEYVKNIDNIKKLLNYEPHYIVTDKHPGFASRDYIEKTFLKTIEVQHHYAHMVSAMVEHNVHHQVIGVIYDGIGYGDDGKLWGGEFLVGDRKGFKRVGQYKYIKIQGGDNSTKNIYKIALSFLEQIKSHDIKTYAFSEIGKNLKGIFSVDEIHMVLNNHNIAFENHINCYETSSIGRIFDAVASILGVRESISYDGQGAIELEALVKVGIRESYRYSVIEKSHYRYIDIIPTIEDIVLDKKNGIPSDIIASKFHNTLVNITVDMIMEISSLRKLYEVVLSGGVFENRYLLENLTHRLESQGFKVYFNERIPINDGGISVGQLGVAKEIIEG